MSTYSLPEPTYQVTDWADPAEPMQTQWGQVCYHNWLRLECDRWHGKWRKAWVMEHPDGRVAMFSLARYQTTNLSDKE